MLQSINTQSKLQIEHSLTSFQQKPKTQMEEDFSIQKSSVMYPWACIQAQTAENRGKQIPC